MITFKNRYAEFDNLDDSYNQNVLRNCYHKEYRKNFLNFNKNHNNRNGNLRYSNFNDIRANNYNFNSYQRQNAFTPFPQLPLINANNNINYNNISNNEQNFLPSRSSPNMPSIISYNNNNYNNRQTPSPRYNNILNNSNDNSGFISNNYDTNVSNDNIQFFNESNNLNISNDSQFNQDQNNLINSTNQISIRKSLDNELDELEKERKLLLEQEKLNQLDFELRYLRQKRKADLQRRLAEQQQSLQYMNKIKENEIEIENDYNNNINNNIRKVNYNYRINTFRNNNSKRPYNTYNSKILEEKLKSNVMNDKFYMNELIEEINKMKISQQEANQEFQKKMNDLEKQNESIKRANEKMIEKIKDMKLALSDKKQNDNNDDYEYDLFEQKNNRIKQRKLFENGNINNIKSYSFNNRDNMDNEYNNNFKSLDYNNRNNGYIKNFKSLDYNNLGNNNFYLGKKDKDVEEFNMLNKNLVNRNNNVVVTPLLFNENESKYIKNFELYNSPYDNYNNKNKHNTIGNPYSSTRKEDLYSLIRKNNDRLEKIKELEEKS